MREGPQNEGDDSGQPAGNVVRLPRDWLGPREELVPFGRRPVPPSAADFWGEDAAAIHDALQAPDEDPTPSAPSSTTGVAAPHRRRAALAAGFVVAAAAVAALASVGVGLFGSPSRPATSAKVDIAAVLSGGVSHMLQRGLAIVSASVTRSDGAGKPRHHAMAARRTAHPRLVFKPVHESTHHQAIATISSSTPASADVARATSSRAPAQSTSNAVGGGTSETSISPTRHASSPPTSRSSQPSRATVSPTGESGALGPVHSPNG